MSYNLSVQSKSYCCVYLEIVCARKYYECEFCYSLSLLENLYLLWKLKRDELEGLCTITKDTLVYEKGSGMECNCSIPLVSLQMPEKTCLVVF